VTYRASAGRRSRITVLAITPIVLTMRVPSYLHV